MSGYVYLIGTPIFGWYKIGKSRTPEIRVKDLGVLLPFKLHIIGVWRAENHHLLESTLHEIYVGKRINGEWFEFSRKEAFEVFDRLPPEARVYPTDVSEHPLDKFSNIEQDTRKTKRVIGVRVQKLRGNFTHEEREAKRIAAIEKQKEKKRIKLAEQQLD